MRGNLTLTHAKGGVHKRTQSRRKERACKLTCLKREGGKINVKCFFHERRGTTSSALITLHFCRLKGDAEVVQSMNLLMRNGGTTWLKVLATWSWHSNVTQVPREPRQACKQMWNGRIREVGFRDVKYYLYRNGQKGCFKCQHKQSSRKAMVQDKALSRKEFIRKALGCMLYSTLVI